MTRIDTPDNASLSPRDRRIREQIEGWRDDLLDLTGRNRLLRFRHTRTASLEIREPGAQAVLDRLLAGRSREWSVFAPDDAAPETVDAAPEPALPGGALRTTKTTGKDVRAACAGLSRRAAGEFMERGIWVLYLGIGMLRWCEPADARADFQDSPVLLLPVRLEPAQGGNGWNLLPTEEEALLNPALWLKLESELGLTLPELDPEEPIVVAPLLSQLRDAVSGYADWTVTERIVLSTFSFHKEAMYRDLRDNFEQIAAHGIVGALATDAAHQGDAARDFDFEPVDEASLDERFPPEQAVTILDADASQRQCIAAALGGESFVMDGPPGTGKSQTIANIIAELVAHGKTVLFVSEKAAALDVVHNRLADVGLDEYVLELHSHKTTRAAVATALGSSLLRRPVPNPTLAPHELNDVERRRTELSRYAQSLNEPIAALGGRTLHHLLGWIAGLQHLPQAPVASRPVEGADELAMIREFAERVRSTWEVVERGDDFVWRGTKLDRWDASTEQRVQAVLDRLTVALDGLRSVAEAAAQDVLLAPPAGVRDSRSLARTLAVLARRAWDVPAGWISDDDPDVLRQLADSASRDAVAWQAARDAGSASAGDRWRTVDEDGAVQLRVDVALLEPALLDEIDAAEAHRLATAAARLADKSEEAWRAAADLSAQLGLRSAGMTVADAEAATALARLAEDEASPPALWLADPDGIEKAQASVDRLAPLLAADIDARSAADMFDPAVLDLDVEGLVQRFAHEHRGLKKLGGAYRADRDSLAATAPGMKPKAAIASIEHARTWKQAREALTGEAARQSSVLATAWNGPETDIARLRGQLDVAARARHLAGGRVADRGRFAETVAGDRATSRVAELVAEADDAIAHLRSDVPERLAAILDRPLEDAAREFRHTATALHALADMAGRVDAIRGAPGSLSQAIASAEASRKAAAIEAAQSAHPERSARLGPWAALDVDPAELDAAMAWSRAVRDLVGSPTSRATAARLTAAAVDSGDVDAALDQWQAALEAVLELFGLERRGELALDLEVDFDDAVDLIERLRETRGDIETWIDHASAVEALRSCGLADALAFCVERRISVSTIVGVLRRSALEATADEILNARRDALGRTRSIDRDRLVREYRALDRAVVRDAAHRVMAEANARRPNTILGAAAVIKTESQKKRKHMPVAHLLAQTAPVAQAIKPCFMMSPLSVSQFLSADMHFDVVIFDEASQVRPADAVNALYRGRAMIVAGDQKQLPPTSFFERTTDDGDEWTEDALAEFDSVLDLAKAAGAFRSLSLRWHYRSRHEHLIAFSNHRFYGGDLVTFPSPAETAEDLGVELVRVNGVYRRGTSSDNPIEAACVAERVFAHAERGERSIGVVAFSEAQASLIEEVLRQDPRRHHPRFAHLFSEDRLAALFVKNLENVQGDERDTIIFSVGYGPDEHGKLTLAFGPVNREGGWRRLNVAITRARKRVEVVCSFPAERLTGSSNRGVEELRRYLDFAERGPAVFAVDDAAAAGGEPESPFEESVLRALRAAGHDVVSQVGTAGYRIDLAVRHPHRPGRFAIGIECDGAMYHSSRVARDRDRLREQVLVGLGWTLHRIWGPSWYRDRPGEERRLNEAIERAMLDRPPERADSREAPPERVMVTFEEIALDAPPTWAQPYAAADLPPGRAFDLTDLSARGELRALVLETVDSEAPIVGDLLARRVVGAWGMSLTEKRRVAIQRVIDMLLEAGALQRHGDAYCLPNQTPNLVRVPVEGDARTQREIKHVPEAELSEAIVRLVAEARVVADAELLQRVARLFGWRRSGAAIQSTLGLVAGRLVEDGRLEATDGRLRPPVSEEPAR